MNLENFNESQQQALLDLVMLAMYADGHLAGAEDARVLRLLGSLGLSSDHDRDKYYDAAVSRISRHARNRESAQAHAAVLVQAFTQREQRRFAGQVLDEVVTSDGHVAEGENALLALVREALEK